MMEIWSFIGYLVVSVLAGTVTAGIALLIGGVGGLSHAVRRINLLEHKIDDTDTRITKEVKTRAALKAVEAKAEQRTAKQIAEEHLANVPAESHGRPKVIGMFRNQAR